MDPAGDEPNNQPTPGWIRRQFEYTSSGIQNNFAFEIDGKGKLALSAAMIAALFVVAFAFAITFRLPDADGGALQYTTIPTGIEDIKFNVNLAQSMSRELRESLHLARHDPAGSSLPDTGMVHQLADSVDSALLAISLRIATFEVEWDDVASQVNVIYKYHLTKVSPLKWRNVVNLAAGQAATDGENVCQFTEWLKGGIIRVEDTLVRLQDSLIALEVTYGHANMTLETSWFTVRSGRLWGRKPAKADTKVSFVSAVRKMFTIKGFLAKASFSWGNDNGPRVHHYLTTLNLSYENLERLQAVWGCNYAPRSRKPTSRKANAQKKFKTSSSTALKHSLAIVQYWHRTAAH